MNTTSNEEREAFGSFGFTNSASGIMPSVPHPLAKETPSFTAEFGVRTDDLAMVFHFYPMKGETFWDRKYRMDKRLERAIAKSFDTDSVTCGFVGVGPGIERESFYVIVGGLGGGPDPWPLVERFLKEVEKPL